MFKSAFPGFFFSKNVITIVCFCYRKIVFKITIRWLLSLSSLAVSQSSYLSWFSSGKITDFSILNKLWELSGAAGALTPPGAGPEYFAGAKAPSGAGRRERGPNI